MPCQPETQTPRPPLPAGAWEPTTRFPTTLSYRIAVPLHSYDPQMPTASDRETRRESQAEWRRRAIQRAGTKPCECGCGERIPAVRNDGRTPRRFAYGHSASLRRRTGETKVDSAGYVVEYVIDDESGRAGWQRQHRLAWERANGPLPPGAAIHHKDGDKQNNDIQNLELVGFADHAERHWRQRWSGRKPECSNVEHLRAQAGDKPNAGVTPEQVAEIRRRIAGGERQQDVAADLNLNLSAVSRIWTGKTWACRICRGEEPRRVRRAPKRPPRSAERTERLILRVSPLEKAAIEREAAREGLTMSDFVRRRACGAPLHARGHERQPASSPESAEKERERAKEQALEALAALN